MGRILFTEAGDHSGHEDFLEYLLPAPFVRGSLFAGEPPIVSVG